MLTFIIGRVTQALAMVAVMSALVFAAIFAIGNPVDVFLNEDMTQTEIEAVTKALGLDLPLWQQYLRFVSNIVHGDFGSSFVFGRSALSVVLERLPATLELAFAATIIALLIGLPVGLCVGLRPGSRADRAVMSVTSFCFSVPTFWAGLLLVLIFSVELKWLPTNGRGETVDLFGIPVSFLTWNGLRHLFLPAFNLSLPLLALIVRLTRAGTVENMGLDYIRFARAKGIAEWRIVFVHLLRNIAIPILTVTGLQLGSLIAFAVVTENVFGWPGIGKLIVDSIMQLDRPVIVAHLVMVVLLFSFINMLVDIAVALIDPRVRMSGKAK